jgi:type I restriction enzyme R subunit
MSPNEAIVEDTALEWFGELGAIGHGPHLAPGEPAAERDAFGEMIRAGRLCEAIRRLDPAIPEEARATIRQNRRVQIQTGSQTRP